MKNGKAIASMIERNTLDLLSNKSTLSKDQLERMRTHNEILCRDLKRIVGSEEMQLFLDEQGSLVRHLYALRRATNGPLKRRIESFSQLRPLPSFKSKLISRATFKSVRSVYKTEMERLNREMVGVECLSYHLGNSA